MIVEWPPLVLAPRKVTCEPSYGTMSGGRSITGLEQISTTDAGYWEIALDEIPLASALQKQTWRAVSVQLEGRLGRCIVPIYDTAQPWPIVGGSIFRKPGVAPFSDGSIFNDTTLWKGAVIDAVAYSAAAMGATQVQINLITGSSLQPGQHFSFAQRLYRIKRVVSAGPVTGLVGEVGTVNIWPPLRVAVSAGDPAEFNRPVATCRLKTDGEMKTGVDDYAGRTLAKVNFVEALP